MCLIKSYDEKRKSVKGFDKMDMAMSRVIECELKKCMNVSSNITYTEM